MSARLDAVSFDVEDPGAAVAFWAGLLDRQARAEPGGVLVPGTATQVGLRFERSSVPSEEPSVLHLHLTSDSPAQQEATVRRALLLGRRRLDVGQEPDAPYIVLADPGGNALCVIEAGNRYLAETGFLGEVTCDGARAVGLFWRDALGWPLVLDEGEQTAIQSPRGGTKISWDAWGTPPPSEAPVRNRQRFDLAADAPAVEARRLEGLGARRLADRDGQVAMADPSGAEFVIRGL